MLISPESYINRLKDKSYEELLVEKEKLQKEISNYEKCKYNPNENLIHPSPDVYYQWNLECLSLLCNLIKDKFNRIINSINDEEPDWLIARHLASHIFIFNDEGTTIIPYSLIKEEYPNTEFPDERLFNITYKLLEYVKGFGIKLECTTKGDIGLPYNFEYRINKKKYKINEGW